MRIVTHVSDAADVSDWVYRMTDSMLAKAG